MKKFIAVMMILVMMVGVTAHAELRFRTAGTEKHVVGTDHKGREVKETIYYLLVESDAGDSAKIEVTEDEYKKVFRSEESAKKSAFGKVRSAMTFWNPDD